MTNFTFVESRMRGVLRTGAAEAVARGATDRSLRRIQALICHPGTQHAPKLVEELERLGALHEYWTALAISESSGPYRVLDRLLPGSVRAALGHRTLRCVAPRRIRQIRRLEARFLLDRWRAVPAEDAYNSKCQALQDRISQRSIKAATHIIGFDCASWVIGRRAVSAGKPYLLDRTAPHPNAHAHALETIIERHGAGWLGDTKPAAVREIEDSEHDLASRIVVASSFARKTLIGAGIEPDRIFVNAYGVDAKLFAAGGADGAPRPTRFLFVGAVSALKGMPVLFDAWSSLPAGSAKLTLAGRADAETLRRTPHDQNIALLGKRAHAEIPKLMSEHDVFVFPTYFDGFGLVLLEAMACGLPVIASTACAGPDLITDGVEGFVVPPGDAGALARCMRHFIDDPDSARRMGYAARKRAESFTWNSYGNRWLACLEDVAC